MSVGRRKAREQALQVLYQIDLTKQSTQEAFPLFHTYFLSHKDLDDFTTRLVKGVEQYREEIDGILKKYSEHWTLDRMSRIDHNILRVAVFELLWCPDIPPKVSINEAIELGKKFSTEKSSIFINGILDKVSHAETP